MGETGVNRSKSLQIVIFRLCLSKRKMPELRYCFGKSRTKRKKFPGTGKKFQKGIDKRKQI